MAVNLVGQVGREHARELLEQSFAQFQADRAVVGLARQIHKADEALEGYRASATCELGDFMEYAALRRELSDLESSGSKARRAAERDQVVQSLTSLKIGDVINVPAGRWAGLAVVLDPGHRSGADDPRPMVLTANRHARRLAIVDFPTPVEAITRMRIPKSFNSRNPQARRDLASSLRDRAQGVQWFNKKPYREHGDVQDPRVAEIRAKLREHPCHACPDRESHARWAERYLKLERDTANQRRRIEQRTNTVARQFDRVCEVLRRARLPRRRRGDARRAPAAARLQRARPAHQRVPARAGVGRAGSGRPRGRRQRPDVRVADQRRHPGAAAAEPARARGHRDDELAVHRPEAARARAPADLPARARLRLRPRRLVVGAGSVAGRRAARDRDGCRRLRARHEAADRRAGPGRRRCRCGRAAGHRAEPRSPSCAVASCRTRRSSA